MNCQCARELLSCEAVKPGAIRDEMKSRSQAWHMIPSQSARFSLTPLTWRYQQHHQCESHGKGYSHTRSDSHLELWQCCGRNAQLATRRPSARNDLSCIKTWAIIVRNRPGIKLKPTETLAKSEMFILRSDDGSTVLLAPERCTKCTKTAIGTYVANVYESSGRLYDVTKGEIHELHVSSGFGWW